MFEITIKGWEKKFKKLDVLFIHTTFKESLGSYSF